MVKGSRNRIGRNARHTVYNLSLAIGLVAALSLAATAGGPFVTEVHAEDIKKAESSTTTSNTSTDAQSNNTSSVDSSNSKDTKLKVVASDIVPAVQANDIVESNNLEDPKLRVVTAPKEQPKDVIADTQVETTTTLDSVSNNADKTLPNPVQSDEKLAVENPVPEVTPLEALLEAATSETEYIWKFLTASSDIGGAGMTEAGAAAIMGCMQAESGFNTGALNKTDGGYGLLQWTDTVGSARKSNLINWCNENGEDYSSVLGQLKFALYELQTKFSSANGYRFGVYETLVGNDSIEDCLTMFFCHAEAGTNVPISADYIYAGHTSTLDMYNTRLSYSNSFYNQFA